MPSLLPAFTFVFQKHQHYFVKYRWSGLFGPQTDLEARDALLSALLFGEIQIPK